MRTTFQDALGLAVIFGFIGLGWFGFSSGQFSPDKAMGMALIGIPLGLLAPVICAPRRA